MAATKATPRLHDNLKCPLCLMVFKMPRILPCFHSFCQGCLQSHISKQIKSNENARSFQCPICDNVTRCPGGRKTSDLAIAFPLNTVASFLLSVKNEKAEFSCDPCKLAGKSITAEEYCMACDETLCKQCTMYHKTNKTLNTHEILNVVELTSKPEYVIKLSKTADCPKHSDQEVEYYCKDHKILYCGKCQNDHRICSNKRDLVQHAREEIEKRKVEDVMKQFWNLLEHLETFIKTNKENVKSLASQVEQLTNELQRIRNKLNETLDELEIKVRQEGERRSKKEANRMLQENERCKSIIASIRNSYKLMETMTKYGLKTDFNIYLTLNKMENHLEDYNKSVNKYFSRNNYVTLELNEQLKKLCNIQIDDESLIFVNDRQMDSPPYKQLKVSSEDYTITRIKVVDIQDSVNKTTHYTGVAFSNTGDSYVLVDRENNRCLLFTSSNNYISQVELPAKPWDVCFCGENDVAVSFPEAKLIQISKLKDNVFDSARTISVDMEVSGLAALGKDKLVFSGKLNRKYCWSVIQTGDGKKLLHFEINESEDVTDKFFQTYLAVNSTKDRVYISCSGTNFVYCYGLDGRVYFRYQHKDLNIPFGIDIDSENNVYVVGYRSFSIHQISPEGRLIQIVQSGVPLDPVALTFEPKGENFIVTGQRQTRKLCVFRIKYNGDQK